MPASHVPLKVQKALLGRILVHGAFEPYLRRATQLQLERADFIIEGMKRTTRQAVREPDDAIALNTFVGRVLDAAESELNGRWNAVQKALAEARTFLEEPRFRDDACITLLTELFRLADDIARAYHEWAFGASAALIWPEAIFCTEYTVECPHWYESDIHVSAHVERTAQTLVWLTYGIEEFDWRAYLATVYVLVHECFHYFEGCEGGVREGERDDPFVEGWMDRVAFLVTDEVAKGRGPLAHRRRDIPHVSYAQEFARSLHDARSAYARIGPRVWLSAGREAADRLLEIFTTLTASPDDAWRLFVRLSILIHRQGWPKGQHLKLVEAINGIGDLESPVTSDGNVERWYDAIRKYLELQDMESLVTFLSENLENMIWHR